jgi:hypothetical protein
MAVSLILSSKELSEEDIQELTSDLCQTIIMETDVDAKLGKGNKLDGTKGEPITIGLIVLTLIKAGAGASLFKVLGSYFEREKSLIATFRRNDGTELTINVKNMGPQMIEETFNRGEKFLESSI